MPTPDCTPTNKKCSKCKQSFPREMFGRDRQSKDGLRAQCKPCRSAAQRKYAAAHRGKICAKKRIYYAANKEKLSKNLRKYRADNGGKRSAQGALQCAVKRGNLPPVKTQFCFMGLDNCTTEAADYHHVDYSQPLAVIPLCKSCHKRLHAAMEEQE